MNDLREYAERVLFLLNTAAWPADTPALRDLVKADVIETALQAQREACEEKAGKGVKNWAFNPQRTAILTAVPQIHTEEGFIYGEPNAPNTACPTCHRDWLTGEAQPTEEDQRDAILNASEEELRVKFGDEEFERLAASGRTAVEKALTIHDAHEPTKEDCTCHLMDGGKRCSYCLASMLRAVDAESTEDSVIPLIAVQPKEEE